MSSDTEHLPCYQAFSPKPLPLWTLQSQLILHKRLQAHIVVYADPLLDLTTNQSWCTITFDVYTLLPHPLLPPCALWACVKTSMPTLFGLQGASTQGATAVITEGPVPAYTIQILSGPQAQPVDPLVASNNSGTSASHPYNARIGVLRELHTKKSDRSCLHVELGIQGSGMEYEAGDHVGESTLSSLHAQSLTKPHACLFGKAWRIPFKQHCFGAKCFALDPLQHICQPQMQPSSQAYSLHCTLLHTAVNCSLCIGSCSFCSFHLLQTCCR